MIQTGYDLPLALSICASSGSGWDRKACAGGAFMENVNTRFGFRSPWLDDEDPLYPVRGGERRGPAVVLPPSELAHPHARRWLLRADGATVRPLDAWARTCFQGFGRDVAEKARYCGAEIRSLCSIAGTGEADCLLGAARTVANASGRDGIAPAAKLCAVPRERRVPRASPGSGSSSGCSIRPLRVVVLRARESLSPMPPRAPRSRRRDRLGRRAVLGLEPLEQVVPFSGHFLE